MPNTKNQLHNMDNRLNHLLNLAERGKHKACEQCPRKTGAAFAKSCMDHFPGCKNGLLIVLRDPGGSKGEGKFGGAAHTGKLCPICNDDKTAKLMKKFFLLSKIKNEKVYWSNTVLHGFKFRNEAPGSLAKRCCRTILEEMIRYIKPRAILAIGMDALWNIMECLHGKEMPKVTSNLMFEKKFYFGKVSGVEVFGLFHPSHGSGNISRLTNGRLSEDDTWRIVTKKLQSKLPQNFFCFQE